VEGSVEQVCPSIQMMENWVIIGKKIYNYIAISISVTEKNIGKNETL
jgi:hypothetical protein